MRNNRAVQILQHIQQNFSSSVANVILKSENWVGWLHCDSQRLFSFPIYQAYYVSWVNLQMLFLLYHSLCFPKKKLWGLRDSSQLDVTVQSQAWFLLAYSLYSYSGSLYLFQLCYLLPAPTTLCFSKLVAQVILIAWTLFPCYFAYSTCPLFKT